MPATKTDSHIATLRAELARLISTGASPQVVRDFRRSLECAEHFARNEGRYEF
jgi:hypothetical protein